MPEIFVVKFDLNRCEVQNAFTVPSSDLDCASVCHDSNDAPGARNFNKLAQDCQ